MMRPIGSMKPHDQLARVTVYGAGIAGLTVAHELAERGFAVRIVEPCVSAIGPGDAPDGIAVGGLARTQYSRAARPEGGVWRGPPRADQVRQDAGMNSRVCADDDAGEFTGRVFIEFSGGDGEPDEDDLERLEDFEPAPSAGREFPRLRVTGFSSPGGAGAGPRARAELVRDYLVTSLGVPEDRVRVASPAPPMGLWLKRQAVEDARRRAGGDAPADELHGRWVMVERDRVILPGEHGFRFFPSYYRHMFDTMRRIPLCDRDGEETGRTVFDNVVSTTMHGVVEKALHNPVVTPRRPSQSDLSQLKGLKQLLEGGYEARDLQQFYLRIFRYMATSPARRAAELEDISWWDFLCGKNHPGDEPRYRYSERFTYDVKFSGQVLAAFNPEWGDARTNGSTYMQLFLNTLVPRDTIDGVLNGPTSEALFAPWRQHLEALGVEFVRGRLETVKLDARGRVRPYVRLGDTADDDDETRAVPDEDADYYVVATDVVSAEQVTRELPRVGVPGQLDGYTTVVLREPGASRGEDAGAERRDPFAQPGMTPWDRLQTLSGIQYYFVTDVKLVHGHVYFTQAEWALTSISQQQFWARRPRLRRDGYSAVLSVDIGAWSRPSKSPDLDGRTAWQVTQRELAGEVWRQISDALNSPRATGAEPEEDASDDARDVQPRLSLPQPTWFHIDDHIVYEDHGDGALPVRNTAPFLIPVVGDWRRRPGGDPWSSSVFGRRASSSKVEAPELWCAPHGGYWLHWNQLVFAGTYKKTFTRMTTMESANESARHASNAVIDHFLLSAHAGRRRAAVLGQHAARSRRERTIESVETGDGADANTKLWTPAAPDEPGHDLPYRSTLIGDYCQIWNIEEYELPEFEPLRAQDEKLFRMGLPHPWDLARVETWATLVSSVPIPSSPGLGELSRLLQTLGGHGDSVGRGSAFAGASDLLSPDSIWRGLEALQTIRTAVERELLSLFSRGSATAQPERSPGDDTA